MRVLKRVGAQQEPTIDPLFSPYPRLSFHRRALARRARTISVQTPQIIWVDKAINRCNRLDFLPAEACVFLSLPVGKEGIPIGVKNSYLLGNRVDKQTKLGFVLPDSLLRKVRFRSIDNCPGELQIICARYPTASPERECT